MQFKKVELESGEYDPDICAVSKCQQISEVIDGTFKYSKARIPLCEKHWKEKCEEEEKEAQTRITTNNTGKSEVPPNRHKKGRKDGQGRDSTASSN